MLGSPAPYGPAFAAGPRSEGRGVGADAPPSRPARGASFRRRAPDVTSRGRAPEPPWGRYPRPSRRYGHPLSPAPAPGARVSATRPARGPSARCSSSSDPAWRPPGRNLTPESGSQGRPQPGRRDRNPFTPDSAGSLGAEGCKSPAPHGACAPERERPAGASVERPVCRMSVRVRTKARNGHHPGRWGALEKVTFEPRPEEARKQASAWGCLGQPGIEAGVAGMETGRRMES